MKKILFPNNLDRESNKEIVAVLGKFAAVHLGHRELLKLGRQIANQKEIDMMVMMFSELEKENFYSMEERIMFVNEYRPSFILEFQPTAENFSFTHEQFEQYLINQGVTTIVCGHDFRYGSKAEGNIETLKEKFSVNVVEEFEINGKSVRSRAIFEAIQRDDLETFKEMMGHYFFYKGKVVRGLGNGKKFNMPTANVEYPEYKIDINQGIYYSYAIYEGKRYPSLTSISTNPTLDAVEVTYETFIYDFDKDIYDEEIYVELIEKYRESIKFDSIEELIDKLAEDKKLGEKYFNLR